MSDGAVGVLAGVAFVIALVVIIWGVAWVLDNRFPHGP